MTVRISRAAALGALAAVGLFGSARAEEIKIGEINSYSALPSFTEPYRKGWQLALEEINAAGGVDGKKLEVDLQGRRRQAGRRGDRGQRAGRRATAWRCSPAPSSPTSASRSPTSPSRRRSSSSPPSR